MLPEYVAVRVLLPEVVVVRVHEPVPEDNVMVQLPALPSLTTTEPVGVPDEPVTLIETV